MGNQLKTHLKKMIRSIVSAPLEKMGYEIRKSGPVPGVKEELLSIFYQNLKALGFEPRHIVDVGANRGTWTREALKYFPDASYTLLEPQHWLRNSMDDLLKRHPKVGFHAFGAGANEGQFPFTLVDREDSRSFRYTGAEAAAAKFEQISLPVVSLNRFLPPLGLPAPDMIKIDAEGMDIEVLKGASDFFGKTEIWLVEVGIVNKEFKNSIIHMMNYMDVHGYTLFDITDLNRPLDPAVLWLAELVFVRRNGFIDSKKFV